MDEYSRSEESVQYVYIYVARPASENDVELLPSSNEKDGSRILATYSDGDLFIVK